MNSKEAKEEIKKLSDECETLLKSKIKRLKQERQIRDAAGRRITKTIRDPRGKILSQGDDDD